MLSNRHRRKTGIAKKWRWERTRLTRLKWCGRALCSGLSSNQWDAERVKTKSSEAKRIDPMWTSMWENARLHLTILPLSLFYLFMPAKRQELVACASNKAKANIWVIVSKSISGLFFIKLKHEIYRADSVQTLCFFPSKKWNFLRVFLYHQKKRMEISFWIKGTWN